MKVKVLIGALVFLTVLNLATIGSFLYLKSRSDRPFPRAESRWGGTEGWPGRSELTDAQRREMRRSLMELHEVTAGLRDSLHLLEDSLFTLLMDESGTDAEIDQMIARVAGVRIELSRKAIHQMRNSTGNLSAEQRRHFINALVRMRPGTPFGAPGGMRGRPDGNGPRNRPGPPPWRENSNDR